MRRDGTRKKQIKPEAKDKKVVSNWVAQMVAQNKTGLEEHSGTYSLQSPDMTRVSSVESKRCRTLRSYDVVTLGGS